METNISETSRKQLIERFASVQGITYEEAQALIDADTDEEILDKITKFTMNKINPYPMNRKQRRALKKKLGKKGAATIGTDDVNKQAEVITDAAAKLNYIDLIQKLRALNEKKEKEENGEATNEDN